MITQKDVARRARTSLKTVSRVINNDPLVNAETRTRIEAIIAELGYQPSQAARMMRSQRSNIIGFLADRVATTSSSVDLIRGSQAVAWERGKQMMLFNIEEGGPSVERAESQLIAFRAESVIYASIYHRQIDVGPGKLPRILLNCFDGAHRHSAVVPDDYQLSFDVTSAIFDRSYRRPVFLNIESEIVASRLRRKGFIDAAAARGHDVSGRIFEAVSANPGAGTHGFVVDAILPRLMAGPDRPDVILCGQDPMAVVVYLVLADLGLRVGRDVAVVSFDDQRPIVDLLTPGLSTMALPYYEMGRLAMNMAIDGVARPKTVRLPGHLVERDSF